MVNQSGDSPAHCTINTPYGGGFATARVVLGVPAVMTSTLPV